MLSAGWRIRVMQISSHPPNLITKQRSKCHQGQNAPRVWLKQSQTQDDYLMTACIPSQEVTQAGSQLHTHSSCTWLLTLAALRVNAARSLTPTACVTAVRFCRILQTLPTVFVWLTSSGNRVFLRSYGVIWSMMLDGEQSDGHHVGVAHTLRAQVRFSS